MVGERRVTHKEKMGQRSMTKNVRKVFAAASLLIFAAALNSPRVSHHIVIHNLTYIHI